MYMHIEIILDFVIRPTNINYIFYIDYNFFLIIKRRNPTK